MTETGKTRKKSAAQDVGALAESLLAGDRRSLAQAITLIESTRVDHRAQADALLQKLLPHTGRSVRIGISGVPGVGKSTFIEIFGLHVIGQKHRVAVLAVDPSSKRGGGSILGDKTRMMELSRSKDAFIRPSPSGGTLGGVARRTREALLACEAAGFDVILVETVGVGQSETAVSEMVDMFLLLLLPSGGDELQGLKKGIMEMADLLIVNKADGDLKAQAQRTANDYAHAVHLIRPAYAEWKPRVLTCSALEGTGIDSVWQAVEEFHVKRDHPAGLSARRAVQARSWMWGEIEENLLFALKTHPAVKSRIADLEAQVAGGEITPTMAASALLAAFLGKS